MIYLLDQSLPDAPFPDANTAEKDPNGLLAVGGDLSAPRLLSAYRSGIFPWFSDNQPILWWSPDPRTVLFPEHFKVSRSLRKTLRKTPFALSRDQVFDRVIQACAAPRREERETWITASMAEAYNRLHELGFAHSVEVWHEGNLVGGLYGVAIGKVFFGESMFSRVSDASKVALAHLVQTLIEWDYRLIDCQVYTNHLITLGAEEISRRTFIDHLDHWCPQTAHGENWPRPPESGIGQSDTPG